MDKVSSENRIATYHISQVPDPACSQYQAVAGGNVAGAIARAFEHLLRALSHMPPGSCFVEILFLFKPNKGNGQDRLEFYLRLAAADPATACTLDQLVHGGPLSRYYEFLTIKEVPYTEGLQAGCEIVRREDFLEPLYQSDLNYKIPAYYYTISLFTPNRENDYLMLDRVLDCVAEPVTIGIRLEPVNISAQVQAHAAYLADLGAINDRWGIDDEGFSSMEYSGQDGHQYLSVRDQLRPLTYKDPLANDILRAERQNHKALLKRHLSFRIRVSAGTPAVVRLVGSMLADSAFKDGSYRIIVHEQDGASSDDPAEICRKIAFISSTLPDSGGETELKRYEQLRPLSRSATVDELLGIFRFPIGGYFSPCCVRKSTDPPQERPEDLIVLGYDMETGGGSSAGDSGEPRGIRFDQMKKHLFVSGVPGSGKTTAIMNILSQLHSGGLCGMEQDARNIPFMLNEPVKAEYRMLKTFKEHADSRIRRLANDLEIYTPGNEKVSPVRLNPFERIPGIRLDEHIENLLACFMAAMPVSGPLPALLLEALERVYEDHPDPNLPPVMADLVEAANSVLDSKGYSPETNSDILTALEVRIGRLTHGSIGRVLQCRRSVPGIERLMTVPSIIESNRLPAEQACLLILLELNYIREILEVSSARTDKPIFYVIGLEEAHVIMGRAGDAKPSEDNPDAKGHATEFICRMLAELRAYGVCIVIIDQLPSAIAPQAIKITSTKLALRQVANEDREALGGTMLAGKVETEDMARLRPGQAFLFTEGYFRPRRVRTVNLHEQLDLDGQLSDDELLAHIRDEEWFKRAAAKRITAELGQLKEHIDRFDDHREAIGNKVKRMLEIYELLLAQEECQLKGRRLAAVVRRLRALRAELTSSHSRFTKGPYRMFSYLITGKADCHSSDVGALVRSLNERFESTVESGTWSLLGVIDRLIAKCMKARLKETNHAKKK